MADALTEKQSPTLHPIAPPQTPIIPSSGTNTPLKSLLPELPYSIRDHKLSITITWTLLALDASVVPLALFYLLWYTTTLDPSYIFTIITSVFGVISGHEWCYRSWMLLRKEDVRPLGGRRWAFDFFHISYTIGYGIPLVRATRITAPVTASL